MSAEPISAEPPGPFEEPPESGRSLSDLPGSERIGHLLWETSARVRMLAEPPLADLQLSLPSVGALEVIAAEPGITASELARMACKTQQALSQVTGRLERLGYIERRLGVGRGVGLHVTAAGRRALADGTACEAATDAQLLALLGADDAERLRALLRRLREALVALTD